MRWRKYIDFCSLSRRGKLTGMKARIRLRHHPKASHTQISSCNRLLNRQTNKKTNVPLCQLAPKPLLAMGLSEVIPGTIIKNRGDQYNQYNNGLSKCCKHLDNPTT